MSKLSFMAIAIGVIVSCDYTYPTKHTTKIIRPVVPNTSRDHCRLYYKNICRLQYKDCIYSKWLTKKICKQYKRDCYSYIESRCNF